MTPDLPTRDALRRTYRYRLYPTREQVAALEHQLGQACDLYNAALEHRTRMWKEHGVAVSFYEQSRDVKHMRAEGLLDSSCNAWSQGETLRRLDRAFQAFFRRVKAGEAPGYPRFKPRQRYNSLTWNVAGNGGGCRLRDDGRLVLQGVGAIKVRWHRGLPSGAVVKRVSVVRSCGRWHMSVSLDGVPARPLPSTGAAVGLDLGITTFAATSDGEAITGPRSNRAAAASVRRAQRKVARRKRDSHRRRKAVAELARQREHEANVRRDHAHKTARALVERYDFIAVEDLNIRGLAKGMLARDCNDQGWGEFIAHLCDKAESAGRTVVRVDAKHTSQACSACGLIVPKALSVRVHSCPCGYTADRDVNAARNVLARAMARTGPSGANGGEKKPVPLPEKPPSGMSPTRVREFTFGGTTHD